MLQVYYHDTQKKFTSDIKISVIMRDHISIKLVNRTIWIFNGTMGSYHCSVDAIFIKSKQFWYYVVSASDTSVLNYNSESNNMLIDVGESSLFADFKVFYFEVDNLKPSETNMTDFIDFDKPKNLGDFDKLIVTGLFESTLILTNLHHSQLNYCLAYDRSHLKFLQKIDIIDYFEKDEKSQFDFSILPEIEKIIFYRVNEIFLFAVVNVRNFHLIQLLESPI